MEISVSGQQRRTAQIGKAVPRMGKGPAGTGSALRRSGSDRADWSRDALAFLRELDRQDMERRRRELEAKQKGSSDLDVLSKSLKVMEKCQKIAARIMRGDKVPPQDEMFLMEADPDGYKLALVCREPKEKPKEWESVLDEEGEEGGSAGSEGPAVSGGEAAEAAGSSAEA